MPGAVRPGFVDLIYGAMRAVTRDQSIPINHTECSVFCAENAIPMHGVWIIVISAKGELDSAPARTHRTVDSVQLSDTRTDWLMQ